MKHPVKSLLAELRRSSNAAREAHAAKLYDPEALRAAMVTAAGIGFDYATIRGPDGLDLRTTDAAKAAAEWLRGQKVSTSWTHRDGASGIDAASTYDLVLSWKVTADRSDDEGGGAARAGGGSTAPGAN